MKYKLPVGSPILRFSIKYGWGSMTTQKEAIYTKQELGLVYSIETELLYYVVSIPKCSGYSKIKVYKKDLVTHNEI